MDGKNPEWLIANTKYTADGVEVANLTNNMRNLRISNFEDGDGANEKYNLASPSLYIKVTNDAGKIYEIKAGNTYQNDTYVSADGNKVQLVKSDKINELMLSLNDVREKYLEVFPYTEYTEIEVSDATGTLKIVKKDNKWLLGEINIKDAEVANIVMTATATPAGSASVFVVKLIG